MINSIKRLFNISKNIDASMKDSPSSKVDIDIPTLYSSNVSNSRDISASMNEIRNSLNIVGRKAYEQVKSTI
ncbi:hypothetical protein LO80_03195 [Candidatus Francisella endociliophora]|uniref:Uncharacterized protein n=1 Tax=Candidatus Francisella endociliophora TaxID=653937 RepID=A0A097END4_9GAMM|nr:hypothetical protein LO80_03195 [Francisella sp. FSC1006]